MTEAIPPDFLAAIVRSSDGAKIFFHSPERIARLQAIAESWQGTPFHAHGRVKGPQGGASCQSLAAELGRECGWLPFDLELPVLSLRHWRAHKKSLVCPFIEEQLSAQLMELTHVKALRTGDLVWFADAQCEHLGTMLSHVEFIHCILPGGVQFSRLDDATFQSRVQRAWRPIET